MNYFIENYFVLSTKLFIFSTQNIWNWIVYYDQGLCHINKCIYSQMQFKSYLNYNLKYALIAKEVLKQFIYKLKKYMTCYIYSTKMHTLNILIGVTNKLLLYRTYFNEKKMQNNHN